MASITTLSNRQSLSIILKGDNYPRWRANTTLLLKSASAWLVVEGTEVRDPADATKQAAWDKKDLDAQAIIIPSLDDTQFNHVQNCTTAKAIWEKLKEVNSDSSVLNKQQALTKFLTYKMGIGESPTTAFEEIDALARALGDVGMKLDESLVISKIITSLPDTFKAFKKAWDSVPDDKQTKAMLYSRLKKESLEMEDEEKPESTDTRAFFSKSQKGPWTKGKPDESQKKPFKPNCFQCKKRGDVKADCRSTKPTEKGRCCRNRILCSCSS